MSTSRWLRVCSGVAGALAVLTDCVLAHTSTRGIVVLLSAVAVGALFTALATDDERGLVLALVLDAGATAVSFYGSVSTRSVVGAAVAGVLSLLSAELGRWSAARPPGSEARGRPALSALALMAALGLVSAAGGTGLVEARQSFAGLGLAALGLGVLAAVGLMVLVGALSSNAREGSG